MCESIGHRPLWGRCPKGDDGKDILFTSDRKKSTKRQVWNIKEVKAKLGSFLCKHIPFLHAFWAAAPKGSMTYAFTHMGNFLLLLLLLLRSPPPPSLQAHISAWRPIFQPRGPNPSLEAQIPPSRPKSQSQGPDSSLRIWASKLGFGPRDWNLGLKTGI